MFDRLPPVSLSKWLDQFNDDPIIPPTLKNGAEGQLKVYDTTFKSGSDLNSTQNLHLRTICHKYLRIEALGDLMKDEDKYTGFVSAANMSKASEIFRTTKPKCQNYLEELAFRESEEAARSFVTRGPGQDRPDIIRVPYSTDPVKPSLPQNDNFWRSLHHQLLTTTRISNETPATHDFERTSNIVRFGWDPTEIPAPSAVNQAMPPFTPLRGSRPAADNNAGSVQSTPDVASYYPARGGKSNPPASDETFVNTALLEFLHAILLVAYPEFKTLDWLADRLAFQLTECVTRRGPDGEPFEETRKLMEARVDGYLCRRGSPYDSQLNTAALAIVEVKPFTLLSHLSAIRRQQGAELASWISQDPYTLVGLLQPSTSGRERRLMISQHRHEIYVTVAEYGQGFKKHIRPSRTIVQGPLEDDGTESGDPSPSSTTTERGSPIKSDNSSSDLPSTPLRRNPALLAGSPGYISRVEGKGIQVAADPQGTGGRVQPTRPTPEMEDRPGTDARWTPEPGDFLIMHEFGPFSTKMSRHMEIFIKRFTAFSLQLRGPLRGFFPAATEASFLRQVAQPLPSALSEPGRTLRKSRSWQGKESATWAEDWKKPYNEWHG